MEKGGRKKKNADESTAWKFNWYLKLIRCPPTLLLLPLLSLLYCCTTPCRTLGPFTKIIYTRRKSDCEIVELSPYSCECINCLKIARQNGDTFMRRTIWNKSRGLVNCLKHQSSIIILTDNSRIKHFLGILKCHVKCNSHCLCLFHRWPKIFTRQYIPT